MPFFSRETKESQSIGQLVRLENGVARFTPVGEATLDEAIGYVEAALRYCRENGHTRLLADISGLNGVEPPTIGERYNMVERWFAAAGVSVVLALVATPHIVDPQKIGATMAYNRGFRTDVFLDRDEALAWLASR